VERTFGRFSPHAEGSASVDGVVLGVDTHLDLCTWRWLWTSWAGAWVS
jgi:hypothetical protein